MGYSVDLKQPGGIAPLDNLRALSSLDDVARDGYHPATLARVEASKLIWTTYQCDTDTWAQSGRLLSHRGFIFNPLTQSMLVPQQWAAEMDALLVGDAPS